MPDSCQQKKVHNYHNCMMPVGKDKTITTNADTSFLKKDISEDSCRSDLTTAPNLTRKKGFGKLSAKWQSGSLLKRGDLVHEKVSNSKTDSKNCCQYYFLLESLVQTG